MIIINTLRLIGDRFMRVQRKEYSKDKVVEVLFEAGNPVPVDIRDISPKPPVMSQLPSDQIFNQEYLLYHTHFTS